MTKKTTPDHVAIIPDGNRRWAKSRGLGTIEGHYSGAQRFIELARYSRQKGIHTLTGWAFSTENWKRDLSEVHKLMELFIDILHKHELDAHQDQVRIRHLGRKDRIPDKLRSELERVEEQTAGYTKYDLNIALDYGGQNELLRAFQKATKQGHQISSEQDLYPYLDTGDQHFPNVDLLIRTSGEQRTSGLLPFQLTYAEFYFTPIHFPDFDTDQLDIALQSYSNRDRRMGGDTKT
jgi:undecaprenyl diphosphate synthase